MNLLVVDDDHYARLGDLGTPHEATELFHGQYDKWHHPAETVILECIFH